MAMIGSLRLHKNIKQAYILMFQSTEKRSNLERTYSIAKYNYTDEDGIETEAIRQLPTYSI